MESIIRKRISEDPKLKDKNVVCSFPRNMLIELTNACNDSCLFCANSKCTKTRGIIDRDFAKRILEQAYQLGTREVGFYGTGEPLIDKNLEEYIQYAKSLGYEYIYITTNGALLTEDRAEAIIRSGIDSIKFSINASNAKDYLLIHGVDDFDKVIENLICLDSIRKKNNKNTAIYISYVLTRFTYEKKEEFKQKYGRYVDDIIFYDCLNTGGYMSEEVTPHLSVNQKTKVYFENDICPMIFKNLYITYEGYLTMCCADIQNYLAVADLKKESLDSAWNNAWAQELRKRHLEHKLDRTLCYNCIHDCSESIEPLRSDLAVCFDHKLCGRENEIKKRVEQWSSNEKG